MDILLEYTEDGVFVRKDDGDKKVLVKIRRDEDSSTTITKLLQALMIDYKEKFCD
jgi:hypothetical protein